jgi:hypothetical protein
MATRLARERRPAIRTGYEHFRVERQGELVSRTTLDFYNAMILPFRDWLDGEGVQRFEHLDVDHSRLYRARLASTPGRHGRPRQPATLHGSHRAIGTFLRWAIREGYPVDAGILSALTVAGTTVPLVRDLVALMFGGLVVSVLLMVSYLFAAADAKAWFRVPPGRWW